MNQMRIILFIITIVLSLITTGQTTSIKQPNCSEIKGLQTCDNRLIPENYTGIMFLDGMV